MLKFLKWAGFAVVGIVGLYVGIALLGLGFIYYRSWTWDEGRSPTERKITLKIPETDATLNIYSQRSHPMMPEFERRMTLTMPNKPVENFKLWPDTTGGNVLDVFVKRTSSGMRVYITSPRLYETSQIESAVTHNSYPELNETPTTEMLKIAERSAMANAPDMRDIMTSMALESLMKKEWVQFDRVIPISRASKSDTYTSLTHLGHFDTKLIKWVDDTPKNNPN